MNITTKRIVTAAVGAAVAIAPLAALADDGSNVDVEGGAHAGISGGLRGFLGHFEDRGANVKANLMNRMGREHEDQNEDATSTSTTTMHDMGNHGEKGIGMSLSARIDNLVRMEARVDSNTHLSADQKTALKATLDKQIAALRDIQTKLQNGGDVATLKTELKTEWKGMHGEQHALAKVAAVSAGDRTLALVAKLQTFGDKLKTRIDAAKAAGQDVTASETAYADFTTQVATAKTDAQAAASLVANLNLDTTDQATIDANKQAIVNAKAKIDAARTALTQARMDIGIILKDLGVKVETEATTTESH